jgi:hypothetical protein
MAGEVSAWVPLSGSTVVKLESVWMSPSEIFDGLVELTVVEPI